MQRRVRVHGTDDNLDLRIDTFGLLRGGSSQRKRANTLAVETHIFRKALRESHLVALFNEVAEGKGIASSVTGGEALVSHIEEGEEAFLLDNCGDLFPLLLSWVDAGRVVCARMEKDNTTRFGVLGEDKRGVRK